MPVPVLRKISETIIDFGKPLMGPLDADQPCEVVRSTFEIVIMVWNVHVMAMPRWRRPCGRLDRQTMRACKRRKAGPGARMDDS